MEMTNLKISSSPHVRSKDTTSDIMFDVIIALVPATVVGLYNFGLSAACIVAACITTCILSEYIYQKAMKKTVTVGDFSAAVTGLLLALNLPPTLPIWMAMLGSVFAIIVVKQLFGGLGQNFMNPALAGRCFLLMSFLKPMTNFVYDGVTSATPLATLKAGEAVNLKSMFLGFTGGTIGETSTLAILIGAAYLLARRVISPKIPVVYIGTFAIAIAIYGAATGKDVGYFLLAHLCGGGLMLGAWFMATDYVTSPITSKGKIVFGVILGLLTFVLRIFGASAEGVSYAIIISNILVPLIEKITAPKSFGYGAELRDKNGKLKEQKKEESKKEVIPDAETDKLTENDTELDKCSAEDEKTREVSAKKYDIKGIARATAIIFGITLVMGAALGIVYNLTKNPIEAAREKAKREAYLEVYPEAADIVVVTERDLINESNGKVSYEVINNAVHKRGFTSDTIDELCFAYDSDGNFIGIVVTITNRDGYAGNITMVVGISLKREITGITFVEINETSGLGLEATTASFREQFVGPIKTSFTYTKMEKSNPNEIDAISGATITTSAVVDGVNAAVEILKILLGGAY